MDNKNNYKCHSCGTLFPHTFTPTFKKTVSSDCKSFDQVAEYGCCGNCHLIQKVINPEYIDNCSDVYHNYNIYYQSDGIEQKIFIAGKEFNRSEYIIDNILDEVNFPKNGRLLDIGCGNGSFLKSFNKMFPNWILDGAEYDDKYQDAVTAIPGVRNFYYGELEEIDEKYDVIALVHTLEHIINPVFFLSNIKKMLKKNALLIIEVPNLESNPFDLLIYDHCSHFTPSSICNLLNSTKLFQSIDIHTDIIAKELTILVKTDEASTVNYNGGDTSDISHILDWLNSVYEQFASLKHQHQGRLGIFGTSISSNWLAGLSQFDFFVDEDKTRIDTFLHKKPVISPFQLSSSDILFFPFPVEVANNLCEKLRSNGIRCQFIIPKKMVYE